MSAVVQLFHRRSEKKRKKGAASGPAATSEGLRLPDYYDFADLRAFLESIEPEIMGKAAAKAAG